jgi:ribonuclease kappa
MKWPICGPKLSLCCTVISIWGIIQFILLGIFFFVQAVPLLDDFKIINPNLTDINAFNSQLKHAYQERAINCWIAAVLYVALLIFTGIQFKQHLSKSSTPNVPTSITSPFAGVTSDGNGYSSQHGIQFSNTESES